MKSREGRKQLREKQSMKSKEERKQLRLVNAIFWFFETIFSFF